MWICAGPCRLSTRNYWEFHDIHRSFQPVDGGFMTNIWSEAIQGLQPRLGAQTYDLWIRPLELHHVQGHRLFLTAPNRFLKEWFENHYRDVVLAELRARTAQDYQIEIDISETAIASAPSAATSPEPAPEPAPAPLPPLPA